jgi:outer membrane receptor protein involved in Fe transport
MVRSVLPLAGLAVAVTLTAGRGEGWGAPPGERPRLDAETKVVTPSRIEEELFESPRSISAVRRDELSDRAPLGWDRTLEEVPGLSVARRWGAGYSPILRGLSGPRVLVLLDGVRLTTAIARFDSPLALGGIDPFELERIELLRGQGATLGAEGIGGTIQLFAREPALGPSKVWDADVEATGHYRSEDTTLTSHLAAEGHLRRLGARVAGRVVRSEDAGSVDGPQRFSSSLEGTARTSALWEPRPGTRVALAYTVTREAVAPVPDRSSPLDFLRLEGVERDVVSLTYRGSLSGRLREIDARVSYLSLRETRERFRLGLDRIDREKDGVGSLGGAVTLRSTVLGTDLATGIDLSNDWVTSTAEKERIGEPTREPLDRGQALGLASDLGFGGPRYVDGSRLLQAGAFAQDRIPLGRRFSLDAAVRVNAWNVDIPADPSTPAIPSLAPSTAGASSSLFGRYSVGDGFLVFLGVSQGMRAPNIDERVALGCTSDGYDVPSTDLETEKSVSTEAGVKLDLFGIVAAQLFYSFTYLADPVLRVPATLVTPSGSISKIQCGSVAAGKPTLVPVMKRVSGKSALLHNLEALVELNLGTRWRLFALTSFARGDATLPPPSGSAEPMDRVPPFGGTAGLRFWITEVSGFAEVMVRWAARQDRLSSSDLEDPRTCPQGPTSCEGTPGFAVLSLRGAARIARGLRALLAVENLTNERYRIHGSALEGPGLSAIVGLEVQQP